MTKKPILKMGKIFFDFNAYRIRMLCNINIPPLLYNIIYKSSLLSTYYHHFENYQVYFMGHSAGAIIGLMHAYKYPVIKKVLLINPPLKFMKQEAINNLIKEGITNYDKGIINVVLGSKDYSVRETKSIVAEHQLRLKLNVIKGADHNFKGKLKLFMELPNIFFND